jgi:hypothetical protein
LKIVTGAALVNTNCSTTKTLEGSWRFDMKLPVGTRVVMSERGKSKWEHSSNNPHNIEGVIDRFVEEDYDFGRCLYEEGDLAEEDYFPFGVTWDNGHYNSYRYGDLVPAVDLSDKKLEDYL